MFGNGRNEKECDYVDMKIRPEAAVLDPLAISGSVQQRAKEKKEWTLNHLVASNSGFLP